MMWTIVRTYDEMVDALNDEDFDGFLLDHRIPGEKKGSDCANHLVMRGIDPSKIARISTFEEGEYPPGVAYYGKKGRALMDAARAVLGMES